MGRVYAVASAKGGVGKTTTVAALGATLAAAGHDVVAVDADLGAANLGAAVGVDPDGPTLHDVLAGTATLEAATYAGPAGLAVVPGSTDLDAFGRADPEAFGGVVDELDDYDVALVDTGAGLSHDTVGPLGVVDAVLLVSTPERQSLVDTAKTHEVAARLGTPVRGAVLTRTETVPAGAGETLDTDVLATIPEDPDATDALAAGTPLSTYAPTGPAAAAYRTLAAALVDGADATEMAPTGAGTEPDGSGDEPATEDGGSLTDDDEPTADDASDEDEPVTDDASDEASETAADDGSEPVLDAEAADGVDGGERETPDDVDAGIPIADAEASAGEAGGGKADGQPTEPDDGGPATAGESADDADSNGGSERKGGFFRRLFR